MIKFILFGSIYLSINPTNPSTLFGGTWVQIKDGFLFATTATSGAAGSQGNLESGNTRTKAATGNTGSTTLTIDQIPSHDHGIFSGYGEASAETDAFRYQWWAANSLGWHNAFISSTGGGKGHTHTLNSHQHLIPYTTVYMFKRTA